MSTCVISVVGKSACHSSPCKNGGMCEGRVNSTEFTCSCTEGWFGDTCAVCKVPSGVVLLTAVPVQFSNNFIGSSALFSTGKLLCDPNPCHSGICSANTTHFSCQCQDGWDGQEC